MRSVTSRAAPSRPRGWHADPVAVADAALLGVVRVDLQPVLVVPGDVGGAPRLRADVVLAEDAPGGEQQREARA
jgi:hypothetical protein